MATLDVKKSPRPENGIWKWYEKNTFSLKFDITLTGYTGGSVQTGHTFDVNFYKENGGIVWTFNPTISVAEDYVYDADQPQEFSLIIQFDGRITKLFPYGNYSYCIKMYNTAEHESFTLLANGKAEVELCH